jgi:hypothetical protein
MSIVQNLKLLNKPISELAMLPQETIIQMAQAGQIPTAFVAPILGEKAEQAKAGANAAAMMAQQELPTTTVLEGIMAQNAANQAVESMPATPMSQGMPMGLPEEMGIGALPVSEDMVPEFAGGGIVAFRNRGLVDSFDYNAATRDIDAASGGFDYSQYGNTGQRLQQLEALRKAYIGENTAARDELAAMDQAAQQQRAMRLLEAGLGIMGGESPYALSNIGKGAQPALRGYAEDVAAQRKRRAELAGMERAEKSALLKQVLDDEAKAEAANIAAGKGTDMSRFVDNFVAAARARGDTTNEAVLKQIGNERYLALYGAAQIRGGAAAQQAEIAGERLVQTAREKAMEAVDKSVGPTGAFENQYRKLQREDRLANEKSGAQPGDPNYSNKAGNFREKLIEDRLRTPEPKSSDAKPTAASAGAKPSIESVTGAPKGAKIGNLVEGRGYQVLDKNGKVIGYAR